VRPLGKASRSSGGSAQTPFRQSANFFTIDANAAAVSRDQAEDVLEEDALAASAPSDDDEGFATSSIERQTLENLLGSEGLAQVLDFDQRWGFWRESPPVCRVEDRRIA